MSENDITLECLWSNRVYNEEIITINKILWAGNEFGGVGNIKLEEIRVEIEKNNTVENVKNTEFINE